MKKRVVLIGQMAASTRGLALLTERLLEEDCEIGAYLPDGKPLAGLRSEIARDMGGADLVVTGMASSAELADEEIMACELASERGIPFGHYCDTYGVHNRPWFAPLRGKTSFLFVINADERKEAQKIFPNAEIVISGNPTWEDFFFPKKTYEDVRSRLGILPNEIAVMCPGGKNLTVNILHFGAVVDALNGLSENMQIFKLFKIFLSLHPGDLNSPDAYKDFIVYSRVPVKIITKNVMTSSDLVVGSDIIVESASTIGIEAACQRKIIIDFFGEIALARLEEQSGSRIWPPCVMGIAEFVYSDPSNLAEKIIYCLHSENRYLRKQQEEVFPAPAEKGSAVKIMTATIKKYLQ